MEELLNEALEEFLEQSREDFLKVTLDSSLKNTLGDFVEHILEYSSPKKMDSSRIRKRDCLQKLLMDILMYPWEIPDQFRG